MTLRTDNALRRDTPSPFVQNRGLTCDERVHIRMLQLHQVRGTDLTPCILQNQCFLTTEGTTASQMAEEGDDVEQG